MSESEEDKSIERELDRYAKVQFEERYKEVKKISEGGEGSVFEVVKNGQSFAAKVRMNPANNKRLNYKYRVSEYKYYLKEIEILRKTHHPNIVKFKEAFRDKDGNLFIIMELFCADSIFT